MTAPLRVAVLADTHAHEASLPLPGAVLDALARADVVLHAGDVVTPHLLATLRELAPVHAVLGNNDHTLVGILPERLELDLAGVTVGMVHDSGPRAGRAARLRRWFPHSRVVVFGHSHEPCNDEAGPGLLLFNPGSPTQRRRQPHPTMGWLELADGAVVDHRIIRV